MSPRRTRLPEALWGSAVELAREYGLYRELVASHAAIVPECVIEFESSVGSRMRIQLKGSGAPEGTSLLRAWREAER